MEKKSKKPVHSNEEMFSHVSTWMNSGLSQQAFCREHRLAYNTFQYWLKKYKKKQQAVSSFVEMKISDKTKVSLQCEIIFPTGAKLIFNDQADINLIRSLVF
jgi:hypothetical protein